jgi:hypothetical protein
MTKIADRYKMAKDERVIARERARFEPQKWDPTEHITLCEGMTLPVLTGARVHVGDDDRERVILPDGRIGIVDDFAGYYVAYADMIVTDYGDNELARRPARETMAGIQYGTGIGPRRVLGDRPLAVLFDLQGTAQ